MGEYTMNRYEKYEVEEEVIKYGANPEIAKRVILSNTRGHKTKDPLAVPGYKKDFFGNIFRNGR